MILYRRKKFGGWDIVEIDDIPGRQSVMKMIAGEDIVIIPIKVSVKELRRRGYEDAPSNVIWFHQDHLHRYHNRTYV